MWVYQRCKKIQFLCKHFNDHLEATVDSDHRTMQLHLLATGTSTQRILKFSGDNPFLVKTEILANEYRMAKETILSGRQTPRRLAYVDNFPRALNRCFSTFLMSRSTFRRDWFWAHFTKNLFQNSWLGVNIALPRNISRPTLRAFATHRLRSAGLEDAPEKICRGNVFANKAHATANWSAWTQ